MLINTKCAVCGANIKIDSEKHTGNCPLCDSKYFTEELLKSNGIDLSKESDFLDNQAKKN